MNRVKTKKLLILALSVLFAFSLISFVMARPVNADASVVAMKETAEIRYSLGVEDYDKDGIERTGIRFTGFVDNTLEFSTPDAETGVFGATDKYAGIIIGKGAIEATNLVHGEGVLDAPAARWDEEHDTETQKAFNVVLYGIPETAYGELLTARAYYFDGENYHYSATACTRSMAQVASEAILKDNPVGEDLEMLRDFVDGANATLKIGETALVANETVNVELMAGKSHEITVEPAGIKVNAFADVDEGKNVTIDGNNIITGASTNVAQLVIIEVGNKIYYVNVTITPWADTEIANKEGIFAAYDEAAYATTFEPIGANPGTVTYLDAEQAKADSYIGECPEALDGVIKWEKRDYNTMRINLQAPIDMTELDTGFSIRIKTDIVNIGYYTNFILPDGTTGRGCQAMGLGVGAADMNEKMGYVPGEWYDLKFTNEGFAAGKTDITYIDVMFYTVTDSNCNTIYIDKIFANAPWVDADLAEKAGVFAAYDEAGYTSTFKSISANAGTVTYLDAEQAKADTYIGDCVEAQDGVIKWNKIDYNTMRINLPVPIDMTKLDYGFSIRIKTDIANIGYYTQITLPDGTTGRACQFMGVAVGATNMNELMQYTPGEWYDLRFTKNGLAAEQTEITYIDVKFYTIPNSANNIIYIDKIFATLPWSDADIAEGVFAAYDEAGYVSTIEPVANHNGSFTYLAPTQAKSELGEDCVEAQNGVIKWTINKWGSYQTVRLYLEKPIDMTKLDKGFSIRIKTTSISAGYYTKFAFADGVWAKALKYFDSSLTDSEGCNTEMGYTAGEWFDLQFTKNGNAKDLTNITYIDMQVMGLDNTVVYIDSISVIK